LNVPDVQRVVQYGFDNKADNTVLTLTDIFQRLDDDSSYELSTDEEESEQDSEPERLLRAAYAMTLDAVERELINNLGRKEEEREPVPPSSRAEISQGARTVDQSRTGQGQLPALGQELLWRGKGAPAASTLRSCLRARASLRANAP
jgi:hypothetical protein